MNKFASIFSALLIAILSAGCSQSQTKSANTSEKEAQNAGLSNEKSAADGKADAEADLKKGVLKIWTMPLPSPPWAAKHFQICKDNGITLKSTKTVAAFKTEYIAAYNQRMTTEIDKKFGPGFIQKLESESKT